MPDNNQSINALLSLAGVTNAAGEFNWTNLIAGLVFGTIGMVAFMYGKKEKNYRPLSIGIALMVYPMFISNTVWSIVIGIALTAALYFWRE